MRLLFLTSRLPWPPDRGDRLRTYYLLRNLGLEHEVSLVSFVANREEAHLAEQIKVYCKEIHLVHLPVWRSVTSAVLNGWRGLPLQLDYYRSREMRRLVDQLLICDEYQVAYIHLFRMAPYLLRHSELYRIIDLTDVISHEIANSLPYRSTLSRLIYGLEQPRIASYECQVAQWADETWLVSERDKVDLSQSCPQANLRLIPNGVDLDRFFPKGNEPNDGHLIFVGNLNVFHNVDAIKFLVQGIMPLIRDKISNCKLTIVGAGESQEVRKLARQPGVTLSGFVDNLNDALNEAALFVAPLRFSAGVQNKVLEAMAAGVPVITTNNVNVGLGATPGQEILVADDAYGIASQVIELLEDKSRRRMIGLAGRRFVEQRFSWQVAVQRMQHIELSL